MIMSMRCPLCQTRDPALFCKKESFLILKCNSCQNGFLDTSSFSMNPIQFYTEGYHRRTDKSEPLKGYDDYYALQPAFEKTFRKRLKKILSCAQISHGKKRLLDIGCGPGFFLKLAQEDYEVVGIEIGQEAVDYAKNRLGLNVSQGLFQPGLFEKESFDVITMFDTIEHLVNPLGTVREIYKLLRPEGLLALTTGDISSLSARLFKSKWHLITPPEHLYFFSRRGLITLLQKDGFQQVSISYPASYFTADYLGERLVKAFEFARTYREWVRLRKILNKIILPLNLWDIMFLIFRKPA